MLHPATSARRAAVVLGVMAVLFLVATPVAFNQSPPIAVSPPSKPSPTSWLVQPIERGPEFALPDVRCHINAIAFAPGSDTLVAAGDGGLLLASVDGGRTWRAPTVTWESSASDELGSPAAATEPGRPCRSRSDLLGIAWADDMNALVVGRGGTVLLTDDGGKRWSAAPRPAVADLHGAVFHLDGKRGWVVGDGGLLLETRDRGRTWQSVVRATDKDLHAVASGVVGRWLWASGAGVVVASSDGGDRWSAVPAPAATRFTGIALHPDSGAVLLTDEAGTVHTSTDDGATWQVAQALSPSPTRRVCLARRRTDRGGRRWGDGRPVRGWWDDLDFNVDRSIDKPAGCRHRRRQQGAASWRGRSGPRPRRRWGRLDTSHPPRTLRRRRCRCRERRPGRGSGGVRTLPLRFGTSCSGR